MSVYDEVRKRYRPKHIKVLMIAESQPPATNIQSSRQFYLTDRIRTEDRLFTNTIKALYPEAAELTEAQIQPDKQKWLRRFQADGWYMIEALETSLKHEVTKQERQALIAKALPRLLTRIKELASTDSKIILIKSNVFDIAAKPLRDAGYTVLNKELLDYPGRFNQKTYRDKLIAMVAKSDKY